MKIDEFQGGVVQDLQTMVCVGWGRARGQGLGAEGLKNLGRIFQKLFNLQSSNPDLKIWSHRVPRSMFQGSSQCTILKEQYAA